MRILILNTWYYPNMMGGAEHSVKLLAEGLAKRGVEVGVFTIDCSQHTHEVETINGVRVYRGTGCRYDVRRAYTTKRRGVSGVWKKFIELYNPSITEELKWVNNSFKPDVVHANCISGISLACIPFFKKKSIPIIYTVRDFYLCNYRNVNDELPKNTIVLSLALWCYRLLPRLLTRNVTAVVAPSSYMLKYILSKGLFEGCKKRNVIYNCVDTDVETIKECQAGKARHSYKNFIYAGSIVDVKGVGVLLEAFCRTSKVKGSLTICGNGPMARTVEEMSHTDKRIRYLGSLSKDDLIKEYDNADVIIVPSLWAEPFGRVVIEGAAHGLVVIGSNQGGIPEIINTLQCGLIWNTTDKSSLTRLIEQINNEEVSKYQDHVLYSIGQYSLDRQIQQYLSLYSSL